MQGRAGFRGGTIQALDAVIGEVQIVSVGSCHAGHAAVVVIVAVFLSKGFASNLIALLRHPVVCIVDMLGPKNCFSARDLTAADETAQRVVLIPVIVQDVVGAVHHLAASCISVAVVNVNLGVAQAAALGVMAYGNHPPVLVVGIGFIIAIGVGHFGQVPIVPGILVAGQGGACKPGGGRAACGALNLDPGGVPPCIQSQVVPLPGPRLAVLGITAGLGLDAIGIPIV